MNRKRVDYRKEKESIPGIYFVKDKKIQGITFVKQTPIHIDGMKDGNYIADSRGFIMNSKGQIIHPSKINTGYMKYSFKLLSGNYKNILQHRLIKQAFDPIDNPNDLTINHINMKKYDCSLKNLEWVTQENNNEEKHKVFPNDGCNNYRSHFSIDKLRLIVEGIDKGMKYKDILESIGVEVTDNNIDYIGNIKRGITYKKEVEAIRNESSTTNCSD